MHWHSLLKLLGYVNYTKGLKLNLNCNKAHLITNTDADFAANRDDRTSMGGVLILLDKNKSWKNDNLLLTALEKKVEEEGESDCTNYREKYFESLKKVAHLEKEIGELKE